MAGKAHIAAPADGPLHIAQVSALPGSADDGDRVSYGGRLYEWDAGAGGWAQLVRLSDLGSFGTEDYETPPEIGGTTPGILNASILRLLAATTLAIAAGAITVTQSVHLVDTEGAAAADDLDTISAGTRVQLLLLRAANSGRTVTVKHGTGNIQLAGAADVDLSTTSWILLAWTGSAWAQVGGSGGASGSGVTLVNVADLTSPTELNSLAGSSTGDLFLCRQADAEQGGWTLYSWSSGVVSAPSGAFIVNGSSGFFVAIAGQYVSQMTAAGRTFTHFGTGITIGAGGCKFDAVAAGGYCSIYVDTLGAAQIKVYDGTPDLLGLIEFGLSAIELQDGAGNTVATFHHTDGLTLLSGASVTKFSTDPDFAGDSDDAVPTEKAARGYVQQQLRNYIANPGGEVDTAGWATYAEGSGVATPVDGTGGAPTITLARTTVTPLRGVGSLQIQTIAAANHSGEGISYDFGIDRADRNSRLAIEFDWEANSSYQSEDIGVWVYDVTNARLIEPEGNLLAGTSGRARLTFSTTDSTSYRLILHIRTATTGIQFTIDGVRIGPQRIVRSPALGTWQEYSPTIGATTTAPTQGAGAQKKCYWRRVGDTMEIHFFYEHTAAGGSGSGTYKFPLPSGYTADTSKIVAGTLDGGASDHPQQVGAGHGSHHGTANRDLSVYLYDSTHLAARGPTGSNSDTTAVGSGYFGLGNTNVSISFFARVPILGWDSEAPAEVGTTWRWSQRFGAGTRVTGSDPSKLGEYRSLKRGAGGTTFTDEAPTTAPSSSNGILIRGGEPWGTADPAGHPTRWLIYIGKHKHYRIEAYRNAGKSEGVDTTVIDRGVDCFGTLEAYDPNTGVLSLQKYISGSATASQHCGITNDGTAAVSDVYFDIIVSDDPRAVQTAPSVRAYCTTTAGQAIAAAGTIINFDTKQEDTHGAVTTGASWVFTAPVAGVYLVACGVYGNGSNATRMQLLKNGTNIARFGEKVSTGQQMTGSMLVRMAAGDTVAVQGAGSANWTMHTQSDLNWITIARVGD